jgi:DNA-binding CsgD family transcriptional regulator
MLMEQDGARSLLESLGNLVGSLSFQMNRGSARLTMEQGAHTLRGRVVDLGEFGGSLAVLLVIRAADPTPTHDDVLREHFRLTPSEIRVARLLAQGRSNQSIAKSLFISPHTARHHTERIMRKLQLTSRAEVGPKLRSLAEGKHITDGAE